MSHPCGTTKYIQYNLTRPEVINKQTNHHFPFTFSIYFEKRKEGDEKLNQILNGDSGIKKAKSEYTYFFIISYVKININ